MSKTIENLTIKVLISEIEDILDGYHYHAYQQVFAIPEIRQQLMASVLNRVPACYALVEENNGHCYGAAIIPHSIHTQLHRVVKEEIERLVEEQSDWISHHIPQETNPAFAPSSWFG